MLSSAELVRAARTLNTRNGHARTGSRLFDALEPRALLGGDPFVIFTDPDGDICRATLQNAGPGGTVGWSDVGGGAIVITANSTSPTSRLVIELDASDGIPGNERPTVQGISTTGVRTIDAPTTDVVEGTVNANRVRSVTLGDLSLATLSVNTTAPAPRERSTVSLRDVFGSGIQTPGIFERLTARWVTNSGPSESLITAGSIVTLTLDGDAVDEDTRVNINTTDSATEWSVKTLRVFGEVDDGTWSFVRPVQSIRVGGITFSGGGQFSVSASQVRIGSVIADASLRGNWSVGSVGKFTADDDFTGTLSTSGDVDSLRAQNIQSAANITVRRIGQLVVENIRTGTQILAQSVGSFLVSQSVSDSNIRVTSGPSGDGSVGTFTIAGELTSSNVRILGNATAVRLGAIGNATFYVGVQDAVLNGTLVNNVNQFIGGNSGTVGSFTIKAVQGDFTNFENAFVAMRVIGRLSSTARYSTAGVAFGLTFQNITTSAFFRRLGSPPITTTNAGSFTDATFNYFDLA